MMETKIIISCIVFISIFLLTVKITSSQSESEFTLQRDDMVKNQIQARGIQDKRVLEVMRKVKRHLFVPLNYRHLAYEDSPLPIGEGQTISQPYIVALMTELLALKGDEKVLEIGTGSGYQAAILAELAKEVYTIEILEPLAKRAEKLLKELGYKNIQVKCGDGFLGWPGQAPFDGIMVTCAPEEIPAALVEQLAEGGRLVIPVGRDFQELKLVKKIDGKTITTNVIPVRFVPMIRDNKDNKEISLPPPRSKSEVSVEQAISNRRSIREYKDEALTLEEVSQLLWASQGITSDWGGRSVPSAGALYPLEIYLVVGKVKGLESGVFHYRPDGHRLIKVLSGDKRFSLFNASLWQSPINNAPISLVICAEYQRTTQKYQERGKRYVHIEVGHVGQNIYLQAQTLGLATVAIGAFNDAAVKKNLGIKEEPLYIMPVGRPKDK